MLPSAPSLPLAAADLCCFPCVTQPPINLPIARPCSNLAMDSSSVFVDLGCGRGRAVLQVAMHSTVSKAVGIELSQSRLEQAEAALEVLQQQGVAMRPVELRHADISSCSLQEGTHFYICSTAFRAGICRCVTCQSACIHTRVGCSCWLSRVR
eukprot:GHRQ01023185.1.p2 GENE.GHRQ01023185.1~~GHRQ01023185.1.p2  ORF type:complete len:153 (-),score=34.57 GHRQ01023185.1:303-761(-)